METEGSRKNDLAGSSGFGVNDARTGADRDTPLTQRRSWRVRGPYYELVDRFGMVRGRFNTVKELGEAAQRLWPGEEQDEDGTGNGWDCQVAGGVR